MCPTSDRAYRYWTGAATRWRGWGTDTALDVGQFISPHGICIDSAKNIYVGEVSHTNISNSGETSPDDLRTLQRLTKV